MNFYRKILSPDAIIHLKTDNSAFFDYTLEVIAQHDHILLFATRDLYNGNDHEEASAIVTFYEQMWLARELKIHYLRFTLNPDEHNQK